MAEPRIVRLGREHDRAAFRCGEPSLGDYLARRASQDERRLAATCWVLVEPALPTDVLGYYTLAAHALLLSDLPAEMQARLARYPLVGAVLIGRLAVASPHQGRGFGALLLADAVQRASGLAETAAAALAVVDALDEQAAAFYQRFGFVPLTSRSDRLILPLAAGARARGLTQPPAPASS